MSDFDQELIRSLFTYSDGNLYWKKTNKLAGHLRKTGYVAIEIFGKNIMAHRAIWIYHFGKIPKYIDHIDGNKSNNKIENLRLATKSENSWNKNIYPTNKVGIKGIRIRPDNKKYEPRISIHGKRIVLGSYDDLELAELVMIEARNKYHGEFANHG